MRRSVTRSSSWSCSTRRFAILDETDSGLDIDALRIVSEGVNRFSAQGDRGVLLITHYTRILRYIKPDFVHVFVAGRIAEQGGQELAERLEAEGYDRYVRAAAARPQRTPWRSDHDHSAGRALVGRAEYPEVIEPAELDAAESLAAESRASDGADPLRRRRDPRRLPDPRAHHARRAAAGLPGQREHLAEAALRRRGDRGPLPQPQRERRPGDAPARRRGDRGLRVLAGRAGRVRRAPRPATRSSSPRTPPRR